MARYVVSNFTCFDRLGRGLGMTWARLDPPWHTSLASGSSPDTALSGNPVPVVLVQLAQWPRVAPGKLSFRSLALCRSMMQKKQLSEKRVYLKHGIRNPEI